MMNRALRDAVSRLPELPGVYFFKDRSGSTIYIGKAKSLKKRVQSYFTRALSAKTQALVSQIAAVSFIVSASESQAQILEASLIKEQQPKYNISLKDDKSFPWLRFSDEPYPLVTICRRTRHSAPSRAHYFGPYTNAKLLRQAVTVIRRIFGFRSCKTMPRQPCLYYRLKLCPGPCTGTVSQEAYARVIGNIRLFLESKYEALIARLSAEMHAAAAGRRFEEAARYRDQILALSAMNKGSAYFESIQEHEDLRKRLDLKRPPVRIEAFDISNISGQEATGSMVSFYNGKPDKGQYRRFRIKTVSGIDDYAMMREVLRRRYGRLIREHKPLPDLVVIDGGRQHLAVAQEEISRLGITLPILAFAKQQEHVYRSGAPNPIRLPETAPALNVIRRVRDEAHRFARAYHHLLHTKKLLNTA